MSVRYGEQVNIGANIWVKVVRKVGGGVSLSIMAPPDVSIDRSVAPPHIDFRAREGHTDTSTLIGH